MIRNFEQWSANLTETHSLEELRDTRLAIEAAFYINRMLNTPHLNEPLLPALGGRPFTMRDTVQNDVKRFKDYGITPIFVFSGLDVGKQDAPFEHSEQAARINQQAWDLYHSGQAQQAVDKFGSSNAVRAEDLFRYLQSILHEQKVSFQVAPYSAWAQLAYLEQDGRYVDAVAGSSELLLWDIHQFITTWDFNAGEFTSIKRSACVADLGNISSDMFVDACLLSGSALLPTLPELNSQSQRKPSGVRRAVDMMMGLGRTGVDVCLHYQDSPQLRGMNYLDRYKRARLAVKHHVVLTAEGKIEPLDVKSAPGDMHDIIGRRLPDEIYFYLSRGVIGPRVLNWRTAGEIIELPPLDNGDSEEYRTFVRNQLTELRKTTLSLLSHSLHRFYQHSDVSLRCWFDPSNARVIGMKDLPDPKPQLANWNYKRDLVADNSDKFKGMGSIGIAVHSLSDSDFASTTITSKDPNDLIRSKHQFQYNTVCRLLHLRGYLDDTHTLTRWGQVLHTALSHLNGQPHLEEPVVIAIELARLGLLTARNMFPTYTGAPFRGSETDQRNTLLVSRVACLGQLRHRVIGYTGPLSRHLLAYHSLISGVRNELRDLADVCLATMLLDGDAERNRKVLTDVGLNLPFLLHNDCSLGIAVMSYLGELLGTPSPTAQQTKETAKETGATKFFPHAVDLKADLEMAFGIWDAVYAGVKAAGSMIREAKMWDEVDGWLAGLR